MKTLILAALTVMGQAVFTFGSSADVRVDRFFGNSCELYMWTYEGSGTSTCANLAWTLIDCPNDVTLRTHIEGQTDCKRDLVLTNSSDGGATLRYFGSTHDNRSCAQAWDQETHSYRANKLGWKIHLAFAQNLGKTPVVKYEVRASQARTSYLTELFRAAIANACFLDE